MAKNVFQKKKRIAHFQNASENFIEGGNENVLSGCLDYVSNIIENMDLSFKSIHSDYSKKHGKMKLTSDGQKDSISSKPTPSSSKGLCQNPENLKKKFSVSRKFPLMEKSQKILKQIKHNRNISKPRAHLAALPKSPIKADTVKVSSIKKNNQNVRNVRKLKNTPDLCNASVSDISVLKSHNVYNKDFKSNSCKISKKCQRVAHNEGENTKSVNINGDSSNVNSRLSMNIKIKKHSLSDAKTSKDSENETTDSEYERFVKKNKKGLKKKIIKRQKQRRAKSKASIKKSKIRGLKRIILEKYDSENSDNDDNDKILLSNNSSKVSPFKKQKVTQIPLDADTESVKEESQLADVCAQDALSESDVVDNEAFITDTAISLDAKNTSSTLQKTDSVFDSDSNSTLPDVSVCNNKKGVSETSCVTADNVIPYSNPPDVFLSCVSGSSDSGKTELNNSTSDLVIDLCDSDDDSKKDACNEHSTVSVPIEEKSSVIGGLIGLCTSDEGCNNTVSLGVPKEEKISLIKTPQNVIHLDSEESDIEIVDVLPARSKNSKCITDAAADVLDYLKNISKGQTVENDIVNNVNTRNSQLVVKTEKLDEVTVAENRNIIAEDSKYEAVYMTNICNDFGQDKLVQPARRMLTNSKGKELLETSSKGVLDDTALKEVTKMESGFDDDIVILDSVQTSTEILPGSISNFSSGKKAKTETPDIVIESLKYSAHNILKMEMNNQLSNHSGIPVVIDEGNTYIKNECVNRSLSSLENRCPEEFVHSKIKNTPFTKDELELHEVMCSSSKNPLINLSGVNQEYKDLEQMNQFHLIELYKKEFQTYQEIVQTEASVGASLKLLEIHQAEKVNYIRNLVKKYVESDQVSGKICDSFVNDKKCGDTTLFEQKGLNTFNDRPEFSRETENSASKISEVKPVFMRDLSKDLPPSSSMSQTTVLASSKIDCDIKPNISEFDRFQNVQQQSIVIPKQEFGSEEYLNASKFKSNEKQTLKLLNEKCNVCGKEAMAACQNCAKVFFCSHECGRKFWNDGHINECGK